MYICNYKASGACRSDWGEGGGVGKPGSGKGGGGEGFVGEKSRSKQRKVPELNLDAILKNAK